ncbi:hypothetical protein KAR91_51875 [Candidatus Pacearchaeota archaeon]|nr:hypothetical protein [Candidatus Pacearchaeota archaeon]
MPDLLKFPQVHNFLLCPASPNGLGEPQCNSSSWHVCWPKDREVEWYVECCECGAQYKQGLVTGIETPNPQGKISVDA